MIAIAQIEIVGIRLVRGSFVSALDEDGNVPYANLFAAGAVLGGYEYAGPCGFGVPILTGWLAGTWAARVNRLTSR